jgi:hypothetical protein
MGGTNNQNPQNNNQQRSVLRFDTSEWSQILYKDLGGILSVDVELPSEAYNEGYRGEGGDRAYVSSTVKNDDFNGGVLATDKGSFYDLLATYSTEINST